MLGTPGRDVFFGGRDSDTFLAWSDDDFVFGGGGGDHLWGDSGNDYLFGDAGRDRLWGMSGNDFLHGGSGRDFLYGGTGDDIFALSAGVDFIDDFNEGRGARDLISLGMSPSGRVLSSSQFVKGKYAEDASDRYVYDQKRGNLYFDADGSGPMKKDLILKLLDFTPLDHTDILV